VSLVDGNERMEVDHVVRRCDEVPFRISRLIS
jgi:hypothetical protein